MLTNKTEIKDFILNTFTSENECIMIRGRELIKHIKLLVEAELIDSEVAHQIIKRKLEGLRIFKFINRPANKDTTKARWIARKEKRILKSLMSSSEEQPIKRRRM